MNKLVLLFTVIASVSYSDTVVTNRLGHVHTNSTPKTFSAMSVSSLEKGCTYRLNENDIRKLQAVVSRPTIQSRNVEDGKMIERWKIGDREYSVTNSVTPVIGKKLASTFTERMDRLEKARAEWAAMWTNESTRASIAEKIAERRANLLLFELDRLYDDKGELEEKISDVKYILLKPWLQIKLAAVEARIKNLEEKIYGEAE